MYILANVNYTQNSGVACNSVCITRAMPASKRQTRGGESNARGLIPSGMYARTIIDFT